MPAWKKFIKAKQDVVDALNTNWEDRFKANEDLHVARGYLKCLKVEVLALETIVENNFKVQMEEAQTSIAETASEDL